MSRTSEHQARQMREWDKEAAHKAVIEVFYKLANETPYEAIERIVWDGDNAKRVPINYVSADNILLLAKEYGITEEDLRKPLNPFHTGER